jgi:prevent-host-death family protein
MTIYCICFYKEVNSVEWNGKQVKNKKTLSVAEAKSHFSEYISRVAYTGEKYVIAKRGKPVVALVPVGDLEIIGDKDEARGLCNIIGQWEDFEEIEKDIGKAYDMRKKDRGRDVSF